MAKSFRIAIIGPEASGKTELTKFLAKQFSGLATEEYARIYFAEKKLPAQHVLSLSEMRDVMHGQRLLELAAITQKAETVFIDASTIHGPLYAGMRRDANGKLAFDYASVDTDVMLFATKGGYDAFIICVPHVELGWEDDGMRSMPELADRTQFAVACLAFVSEYYTEKPYMIINANTWAAREEQAVEAIKSALQGTRIGIK